METMGKEKTPDEMKRQHKKNLKKIYRSTEAISTNPISLKSKQTNRDQKENKETPDEMERRHKKDGRITRYGKARVQN